jgi:DDE superfamily endonuclease
MKPSKDEAPEPRLIPQNEGRRSRDLIASIWDGEIVPMLRAVPGLRPVAVLRQIRNSHPEIGQGVRRAIERRVRRWQNENDPDPDVKFQQHLPKDQRFLTDRAVSDFLRSAHQGILKIFQLPIHAQGHESIHNILDSCKSGTLRQRNKALLALALICDIPLAYLRKYPVSSRGSLYRWKSIFLEKGFCGLIRPASKANQLFHDESIVEVIFKTLHEPPELHGFHRTNWRQIDLYAALKAIGARVSIWTIRRVIRANHYQWRKAKTVLTSNDKNYRLKVNKIKDILGNLTDDECFFSIDEYGPFSVRSVRGKKLCAPDEFPSVPQWQKSRGTVLLTAALELRTNQITHFYSEAKNTNEMLKMVDVLRKKYRSVKKLYISWDAAGWHVSKALKKRVEFYNSWADYDCAPAIELAPLPSRAQFLNVIESVFSGMSRAVIHNSNFKAVDDAKIAIDLYFSDRNKHFLQYPRRAGKRIWGREREPASFSEAHNCKDPRYR